MKYRNELKIFLKLEAMDVQNKEFTKSRPKEVEILIENYLRTIRKIIKYLQLKYQYVRCKDIYILKNYV